MVKMNRFTIKPRVVVFDLDYTLWPFWVDTHVDPPFKKNSKGEITDRSGASVKCYGDVPQMLHKLHKEGYQLGVASRTSATREAEDLLRLFDWDKFFHYKQIFPGGKVTHFKNIQKDSGIPFADMLFFDDEHRNIVDVNKLGVTAFFTPDGMSNATLEEGFQAFQEKNSKSRS